MSTECAMATCGNPARARGWCGKHYQRWAKYGDPATTAWEKGDPAARFWAKVQRASDEACWPWLGYLDEHGYGGFGTMIAGKLTGRAAHRFAYELLIGPIPGALQLDHLCHSNDPNCHGGRACLHRRCVNPAHLEPVTSMVNIRRGGTGTVRGAQQRAKTHCPSGHEYTAANTRIEGPRRYRRCKTCESARKRRSYLARKKP